MARTAPRKVWLSIDELFERVERERLADMRSQGLDWGYADNGTAVGPLSLRRPEQNERIRDERPRAPRPAQEPDEPEQHRAPTARPRILERRSA
jgi:hypothetical protein